MTETHDIALASIAPVAVEDEVALSVDDTYSLENASSDSLLLFRVSEDAPDADAQGHAIPPLRSRDFKQVAGSEKTWIWTRDPPCAVLVTLAAT